MFRPSSQRPKGPESGTISFLDNAVDTTTGTIKLKGAFANAGRTLWPGQFINVVLTLTTHPDALVVPSQALQTGQQGEFVFVVKPDRTWNCGVSSAVSVEWRDGHSERGEPGGNGCH